MAKEKNISVESVLDLNASNVWTVDENEVAQMWEEDKKDDGFELSEGKLLNILRLAFEVVHFNMDDKREEEKYMNGEWAVFSHANPKKGHVAIRKKFIRQISDLSYENIKHITAATLLELIDRNFGGGWDSIPLSVKDIIESAFDVSTTQVPTSRLHIAGGTLERRIKAGFEVLEIAKGTWTEAIFAKKKELLKFRDDEDEDDKQVKVVYDEDGNPIMNDSDDSLIEDNDEDLSTENDEEYYSPFTEGASDDDEESEEGYVIDED